MKLSLLVFIFVLVQTSIEEEITLKFDDDYCDYDIYKPNEDKSYILEYEGKDLGIYCKYSFIGRSDDYMDEYKTCVETLEYNVVDSEVKLSYLTGYSSIPDRSYGMYDSSPPTFCSDSDEYLDIKLDSDSVSRTLSSRIKLKVYAVKTFDYGSLVGAIVGGVLGGLALLSIVITICIVVACRRKRSSGSVQRPPTQPVATASYPMVQTSTGQYQQAYPPPQPYGQQQPYGQAQPYPVQSYPGEQKPYPVQSMPAQPVQGGPPPQYPGLPSAPPQ